MVKDNKRSYRRETSVLLKSKLLFFLLGCFVTFVIVLSTTFLRKSSSTSIALTKKIDIKKSKIYEVKEGDYLWKIAEDFYGSGFNAYDLARINNLNNPDNLIGGQKIVLPLITPKIATEGETTETSTEQVTETESTYIVQPGDYISAIAQRFYGDQNMAYKIIQANNIANPEIIESGTVLVIPR